MNHTGSGKESSTSGQSGVTRTDSQGTSGQTTSMAMIVTLGSVAMLSGLLVVLTWQLTLESIKENQRLMIEKSIFQIIPGAETRQNFTLTRSGLETDLTAKEVQRSASRKSDLHFYAAYDSKGQLKGIAAEASAQGYAGMVQLLYSYDPYYECIRGFSVIKMAETPGLGDKILTDINFLANFKSLDARLNTGKNALKNSIITVKHGSKNNPWEIDAISGATITSKAVDQAINLGAEQLLPRLLPFLNQIYLQPTTADDLPVSNNKKPLTSATTSSAARE